MKNGVMFIARRALARVSNNNPASNCRCYCDLPSSVSTPAPNTKLFVGGLSWSVDENSLKDAFSSFGDVSEAGDFDVLDWWMGHVCYYPTLAHMAKMVLAVSVSTTVVERAFSAGGDILSARRSSIKPENLEAQTCLDDWVRAAKRNQHKTPSLAEDEDEISSPEAGSKENYDSS